MTNPRKHGNSPYSLVAIHGGPGAAGDVIGLARQLSGLSGVLEPFQTKSTIEGQIKELHTMIVRHCETPVILIGHSWGAWLSYIFTSRFPELVQKLILVSSGSFEEKYNKSILDIRLGRLSAREKKEVISISQQLNSQDTNISKDSFIRLGRLMTKADSYDLIDEDNDIALMQPKIFHPIWREADKLRESGRLLSYGHSIQCPVVALHGNYDPHPALGVKVPLKSVLKDFHFIELDKCGHYPWKERQAKERFYELLKKELE